MNNKRPSFYLGTDIDGVHINAEQLNVRARDLNSLIGTVTYTDAVYHILRGELPNDEERRLFDILLVSFHGGFGLLPPTTFVPRIVAGTGVGIPQALAAGFLASGPYHVGAVEHAMKFYQSIADDFSKVATDHTTAADLEQFAYSTTAARLEAGETVAGFGHPLLRKDPRPTHVRRLLCEMKSESIYFDIYDGVVRCMEEKKGIPANVDGITAAIILRLGFSHQYGTGLFLLARSSAMLAHVIEEQTEMPYQTMRRFMLLPIAAPKLFNADFKSISKRFNKLRDSSLFKTFKKMFSKHEESEFAIKERANRASIQETRASRHTVNVVKELQTSVKLVAKQDRFVASVNESPNHATDLEHFESITSDLPDDCTSPELLAGAAFFLSTCLQSLGDKTEPDERTRKLVASALHLVQEATAHHETGTNESIPK